LPAVTRLGGNECQRGEAAKRKWNREQSACRDSAVGEVLNLFAARGGNSEVWCEKNILLGDFAPWAGEPRIGAGRS
jgi:hypothetical protein